MTESPVVLSPDWPAPPGVRAVQLTRQGGLSDAPFDSCNIGTAVGDPRATENRAMLRRVLDLPGEPLWLRQVHGTDCLHAPDASPGDAADAAWTDRPGVVLAAQGADCLPVLFSTLDGRVIAAAHAGWRGLLDGVLEQTLRAMGAPAHGVQAWIGAAIGPCCFEVGPEVRAGFLERGAADVDHFAPSKRSDHWMADLPALARARLQRAGVARIDVGQWCTACDRARFFSHRRDAGKTGRQAALIWRESGPDKN